MESVTKRVVETSLKVSILLQHACKKKHLPANTPFQDPSQMPVSCSGQLMVQVYHIQERTNWTNPFLLAHMTLWSCPATVLALCC